MQCFGQIRYWQRIALCLCTLSWPALAAAQADSTTLPKGTVSTTAATKAKHPAATHTTGKRVVSNSSRASMRPSAKTSSHATESSQKNKSTRSKKASKQVAKKRGQQAIDSDRAREIQTALIREHYMDGEPTGVWDSSTQAAMQRYQAAQGWQSKTTPDSRALIRLGLGPSKDHLLNPENAMTMTTTTTMTTAPAAANPKASSKQPPEQSNLPQQ
jgi:peptidoglycan hydrolase-like protein with peptidoglycan-binding domain